MSEICFYAEPDEVSAGNGATVLVGVGSIETIDLTAVCVGSASIGFNDALLNREQVIHLIMSLQGCLEAMEDAS